MWKKMAAFLGLGLLFFLVGLLITYVAPPWDPFAHRNRLLYSLALGIAMPTIASLGYWISLKNNAWLYLAFVLIAGSGFLFWVLTSNYPEDPWPSRLGWSIGIIGLFTILGSIASRIEKRQRR